MRFISLSRQAKVKPCVTRPRVAGDLGRRCSLVLPGDGDTGPFPKGGQFGNICHHVSGKFLSNSETHPKDNPIHVQKDSRTRLFIV